MCRERTWGLEHPQAAHAAMIYSFVHARIEMILNLVDGRPRTVPARFDYEFEPVGTEGGLTGIS